MVSRDHRILRHGFRQTARYLAAKLNLVKYNCFSTSYRTFLMFFASIRYKPVGRIEFHINKDILFLSRLAVKTETF